MYRHACEMEFMRLELGLKRHQIVDNVEVGYQRLTALISMSIKSVLMVSQPSSKARAII